MSAHPAAGENDQALREACGTGRHPRKDGRGEGR
jgi:hypothetical protein